MKELSIEEKAQRYDEALRKVKDMLSYKEVRREDMEYLFPELKESEDEKIRNVLIDYFNRYKEQEECGIKTFYGIPTDNILAWLEKQGEKGTNGNEREIPNAAWSEEDEMFVHGLIRGLAAKRDIHGHTTFSSDCIDITKTIDWLKSLKDRVQPKQEWSEEDKSMLNRILGLFGVCVYNNLISSDLSEEMSNWLKSIRPQNTWKPSDEQMEALKEACNEHWEPDGLDPLYTLYQNLKKLKEE